MRSDTLLKSNENRCTLIIRLGQASNASDYNPERWNADPSKFTMGKLPEIIRPLLDNLLEGKYGIKVNNLLPENIEHGANLIGEIVIPNKDDARFSIFDSSVKLAKDNAKYDRDRNNPQYYQIVQGRPPTCGGGAICLISIEFAMDHAELAEALKEKKRINQDAISGIYTNKTNGWEMHNYLDALRAYPIAKETVFPEVEHLRNHLADYLKHLESSNPTGYLDEKKIIVNQMISIMDNKNILYQDKIDTINSFLIAPSTTTNKSNKDILSIHRDPLALRILANIGHVLTLGIVSKISKGTFAFWKPHGEVVVDEVIEAAQKKNK